MEDELPGSTQDQPEFSPDGKLVLFLCVPEGEGGPFNVYWVYPDGTGLEQLTNSQRLTNSPDVVDYTRRVHYVGSSFSPEFHDEGWGDIVAARYPAYGYEGNANVFRMHIEHGEEAPSVTVNLTKSETLDTLPDWGTH